MKGSRAPIRWVVCADCGAECPEARLIDGVCVPCCTPDRWPPTSDPKAEVGREHAARHLYDRIADAVQARAATWRERAACRTQPTWLFFPGSYDKEAGQRARSVCATCPVQAECRAAGAGEHYGIWGGTGPSERKVTVRREPARHGTRSKYLAGCRCHACRAANTTYNQRWRARQVSA